MNIHGHSQWTLTRRNAGDEVRVAVALERAENGGCPIQFSSTDYRWVMMEVKIPAAQGSTGLFGSRWVLLGTKMVPPAGIEPASSA